MLIDRLAARLPLPAPLPRRAVAAVAPRLEQQPVRHELAALERGVDVNKSLREALPGPLDLATVDLGEAVSRPLADTGKTWGNPSFGRPLNFGHQTGADGQLLRRDASGALVWADNGKALTADQFANMPLAQRRAIVALVPEAERLEFATELAGGDAARARRAAPAEPAAVTADPASYFVSQYRSASNTQEDTPDNGNCGPTSLLMIALAFGRTHTTPAGADAAIEDVRRRGNGPSEQRAGHNSAMSFDELARAARSYGLEPRKLEGAGLGALKAELERGRLVQALVSPAHYSSSRSRGHYVVVTGIQGNKVLLNDPMRRGGPIAVDAADFARALAARGGEALSIGD